MAEFKLNPIHKDLIAELNLTKEVLSQSESGAQLFEKISALDERIAAYDGQDEADGKNINQASARLWHDIKDWEENDRPDETDEETQQTTPPAADTTQQQPAAGDTAPQGDTTTQQQDSSTTTQQQDNPPADNIEGERGHRLRDRFRRNIDAEGEE